eukprot:Blabericola_migrator_1__1898@NODE_1516_length_4365_cov_71_946487_g648_i3_p1_GENE_NODE_1516_length_4365_cov_71_946487_g648_i3NODE_1516_length_4365_cov_71_946487_g648_i3_p1_ORF_typecomplete_len637_score65_28_NODE_1516_length_4365_cov_71_946487_g648_i36422552
MRDPFRTKKVASSLCMYAHHPPLPGHQRELCVKLQQVATLELLRQRLLPTTKILDGIEILCKLNKLGAIDTPLTALQIITGLICKNDVIFCNDIIGTAPAVRHIEDLPTWKEWVDLKSRVGLSSPWAISVVLEDSEIYELINCANILRNQETITAIIEAWSNSSFVRYHKLKLYQEVRQRLLDLFNDQATDHKKCIVRLSDMAASFQISLRSVLYIWVVALTMGFDSARRMILDGVLMHPDLSGCQSLGLLRPHELSATAKNEIFTKIFAFLRVDERYYHAQVCSAGRKLIRTQTWEERAMREVLQMTQYHFDSMPAYMLNDSPFACECDGGGVSRAHLEKLISERIKLLCKYLKTWHIIGARFVGRAHIVSHGRLVEETAHNVVCVPNWDMASLAHQIMHCFPTLNFHLRWAWVKPESKGDELPTAKQRLPQDMTPGACVSWLRNTVKEILELNCKPFKEELLIPHVIEALLQDEQWHSRLVDVEDEALTPPQLFYWAYRLIKNRFPFQDTTVPCRDRIPNLVFPMSRADVPMDHINFPHDPIEVLKAHPKILGNNPSIYIENAMAKLLDRVDLIFDRLEQVLRSKGFKPSSVGPNEGLTPRISLARSYYSWSEDENFKLFVANFCTCSAGAAQF